MENILSIKNLNLFFKGETEDYQALYDVNLNLKKGPMNLGFSLYCGQAA